jgi:hypothetical protein
MARGERLERTGLVLFARPLSHLNPVDGSQIEGRDQASGYARIEPLAEGSDLTGRRRQRRRWGSCLDSRDARDATEIGKAARRGDSLASNPKVSEKVCVFSGLDVESTTLSRRVPYAVHMREAWTSQFVGSVTRMVRHGPEPPPRKKSQVRAAPSGWPVPPGESHDKSH